MWVSPVTTRLSMLSWSPSNVSMNTWLKPTLTLLETHKNPSPRLGNLHRWQRFNVSYSPGIATTTWFLQVFSNSPDSGDLGHEFSRLLHLGGFVSSANGLHPQDRKGTTNDRFDNKVWENTAANAIALNILWYRPQPGIHVTCSAMETGHQNACSKCTHIFTLGTLLDDKKQYILFGTFLSERLCIEKVIATVGLMIPSGGLISPFHRWTRSGLCVGPWPQAALPG